MGLRFLFLGLFICLISCQSTDEAAGTPVFIVKDSSLATRERETAVVATTVTVTPTAVPRTILPPPSLSTASPAVSGVTSRSTATASGTPSAELPEGALIAVTMQSQVGVLLDEIPDSMRIRVAEGLLNETAEFWTALAQRQVKLTKYRLNFRPFIQAGKGQLPLPQPELWQINLDPDGPRRETVQEHDLILINYEFSSTLLSDADSPAEADVELSEVGGVLAEPFILPLDPDLLLQRTENACLNEAGFPPNSYDSENVSLFYDHTCTADSTGAAGCHRSQRPGFSCLEMLALHVGQVNTEMHFERLEWDDDLAEEVRIGPISLENTADLLVYSPDLTDNRLIYRYFTEDDCAIQENAVGSSGWRRLLKFTATAYNIGGAALHIGPVTEDPSINVFRYNSCHAHYHFDFYGTFALAAGEVENASKQAFCVESTDRFSNNETTPLTHPYSCRFQGVETGWVDEYVAGLDTQWVDITDVEIADGETADLTFSFNPDQFLCEGEIGLNDNGDILWEASGRRTETGFPISRPVCEFVEDWDANNEATEQIPIPTTGSFVTAPCPYSELGPLRNCGFTEQAADNTCTPGETVALDLQIPADAAPQVVRVCEVSAVLGVGTACTFEDSLVNVIVEQAGGTAEFICPLSRSADEPGGAYALYTAPVLATDDPAVIDFSPLD